MTDYDSEDYEQTVTLKQKTTEKKKYNKKQRLSAANAKLTNGHGDPEYDSDVAFEAMIGGGCVDSSPTNSSKATAAGAGASVSENGHTGPPFSLVTLSEWPRQSDGEPLGLDHFWSHVASVFPEDQTEEVSDAKGVDVFI